MDKYIVNLFTQAFLLQRNTNKIMELMRTSIAAMYDEKILKIDELKKEYGERKTTLASLEEIIRKNQGKAIATVIINDALEEKQNIDRVQAQITALKEEKSRLPRLNEEHIRRQMQKYKTVLSGIDFYARQSALKELINDIELFEETVEVNINLSALADIEFPLSCKVIEERTNIASVFKLRGMDFEFDKLNITAETTTPDKSA